MLYLPAKWRRLSSFHKMSSRVETKYCVELGDPTLVTLKKCGSDGRGQSTRSRELPIFNRWEQWLCNPSRSIKWEWNPRLLESFIPSTFIHQDFNASKSKHNFTTIVQHQLHYQDEGYLSISVYPHFRCSSLPPHLTLSWSPARGPTSRWEPHMQDRRPSNNSGNWISPVLLLW